MGMNNFKKILRNPLIRQAITWGLPILVGWVLSKLDKTAEQDRQNQRKK